MSTYESNEDDLVCHECGAPMIVGPHPLEGSDGVSHHVVDGEIDYDADEHHVAFTTEA